ncbi:Cytochrome P450 86B1 [Rhynchospora pubera]|uniref:Cytochrome P450 86B1 n=1 Tax=Rhynchospora pubera TaxID=906938 RepID=A0AAV8C954_9POAL|nr:Cytochrome P450 86B1 [Rhynchospora pubera]KAJ4752203.1 Cytochrome P450 86B1 [Rhynchospora pubera]
MTPKLDDTSMFLLPLSLIHKHYPELLLAFLSFFLLHLLYQRAQLPINFPLFGALPHLALHCNHLHDWSTDLLRQNGYTCIFKGPAGTPIDFLLTCDPANVGHVFTSNFANYPKGKEFAVIFEVLGDGIFNADYDSWAFQRRKAHLLMTNTKFRNFAYQSTKEKLECCMLPLLGELAKSDRVVDMQDIFLRLTFDITSTFTFGFDPGCLAPDFPSVPFANAMDEVEEILFYRHVVPYQYLLLQQKYNFGTHKRMQMAWNIIDQVIAQYVAKRKEILNSWSSEESERSADLLSSYIVCQNEVGKQGEEFNKFLRDTTFNLMVAGRDTTSAALTWFFYLLHKNPHVEEKILQELKVLAPKNPTFPSVAEIKQLVYLHAALCESLRLYPPVPFEHKAARKPEILPSGVPVNRRRRIMFSIYAMGRMDGIWGKDCLEFRPERWLSESGKLRHEPSYKFMAFNSGPRTCLGKDLAFTQMKAVVAAILTRYRIEVVPGFQARPKFSIILHMQEGLKVQVKPRN